MFCACVRGSVLLWWNCDMFCTSSSVGFVNDVVSTYWALLCVIQLVTATPRLQVTTEHYSISYLTSQMQPLI